VKSTRLLALSRIFLALLLLCALFIIISLMIGFGRQQVVISFVSSSSQGSNILQLMDIDEGLILRIGANIIHCCTKWSPNGHEIIFDTLYSQGKYPFKSVYRMNADGRQTRPLLSLSELSAQTGVWAPDGRFVAYISIRFQGVTDVSLLDTQTGLTRQLTNSSTYYEAPVWSPNGQFIVFTSQQGRDNWDICRINPDGSALQNLTNTRGSDTLPAVSPDGHSIVFISNRTGNQELYMMDADGKNQTQVTNNGKANFAPFFHPDGKRIIFASNMGDPKGRNFDMYMVNIDGTGLERITYYEEFDGFPMFTRDGKKIVFCSNRNNAQPGDTNVFIADWED